MPLPIQTYPKIYRLEECRALIKSISDAPHDDVARLVFADWLEENYHADPEFSDHYCARIEFIRVSCGNVGKSVHRMGREESKWLEKNWQRLFPVTLSAHDYESGMPLRKVGRSGRRLPFAIRDTIQNGSGHGWYSYDVNVRRGFIAFPYYWSNITNIASLPGLYKDDPVVDVSEGICRKIARNEKDTRYLISYCTDVNLPGWMPKAIYRLLDPDDTIVNSVNITMFRYIGNSFQESRTRCVRDMSRALRKWAEESPYDPFRQRREWMETVGLLTSPS